MKKSLSNDIKTVVERIQNGSFSGVEIRSLLISVRYAQPHSLILKELGDFVAHYDERTQGILYEHIDKFMSEFINFAMSGGTVKIPKPLFDQEKIVTELIKVIQFNKISGFNELKFRSQTFKFMCKILELIAGTKIQNVQVSSCEFSEIEKNNNGYVVYFCFGPIEGKLIRVGGQVRIPALIAVKS
jgi:hypothetical protein